MHLVRAGGEEGENVELASGQPHFGARHGDGAARQVDLDVPGADRPCTGAGGVGGMGARPAGAGVRPPAYRVDAGHQLGHPERLHDVVVGARPQPLHDVALLAARGHHDQGRVADGPQPPQQFEPVEVGKAQVQQDELGLVHVPQGVQGPAHPAHRVPALGESSAEGPGHPVVVLDEKRVHGQFPRDL